MTASVNYEPLTPTSFLERSAAVYPDRVAVVDGELRLTYAQLADRCARMAGALAGLGVQPGARVAVLAANGHTLLEAHYGVPWAGAVVVALNPRLSVAELAHIVEHSGSVVLLHTGEHGDHARAVGARVRKAVRLVDADTELDGLLASAPPLRHRVDDERAMIALNYTSGTTGSPKGVMYHHRGAYLQALAMQLHFGLNTDSRYLWTLPMFHCNGWCFTWAVTAAGGTHVCLPKPDPQATWTAIEAHDITHLCGAPTVLLALINHPAVPASRGRSLVAAVGGAPPSPTLLERCAEVGLDITHLYGLTETFGPIVICDWRSEWNALPAAEQAVRRARQGVGNTISCQVRVVDDAGLDVKRDGRAMGQIAVRGNNVMLGYFNDPAATQHAMPDGWLRTGDLGVLHPDGYLELRDRSKDIIISGGENISSVEVEAALSSHPAVLEATVVAVPHERWGERPVAWVTLCPEAQATEADLRAHVRERLAGFKVPDTIRFGDLPKTATGKIQKFRLRHEAIDRP